MMDAGYPIDQPPSPPPPLDDAHHLVVDSVVPALSRDKPLILQYPTYQDQPQPRLRGTETSEQE
jgi:hypothetical protein